MGERSVLRFGLPVRLQIATGPAQPHDLALVPLGCAEGGLRIPALLKVRIAVHRVERRDQMMLIRSSRASIAGTIGILSALALFLFWVSAGVGPHLWARSLLSRLKDEP